MQSQVNPQPNKTQSSSHQQFRSVHGTENNGTTQHAQLIDGQESNVKRLRPVYNITTHTTPPPLCFHRLSIKPFPLFLDTAPIYNTSQEQYLFSS